MSNFFSIQDGSLTDGSIYGYGISGSEIMNATTSAMLCGNVSSPNIYTDSSSVGSIAIHLSARSTNPIDYLFVTAQRTANANVFFDNSSNNLTVTTFGSAYQTTVTPFSPNGWSGYFNGSTDYLLISANPSALQFGTGDFTVEGWYFSTASNTYPLLLEIGSHQATTGVGFFLQKASSFTPMVYMSNAEVVMTAIPSYTKGTWNHFAFQRSSGSMKIFVNGIGSNSVANTTNLSGLATSIGYGIGSNLGAGYYANGYISNLRIHKGIGLYTSNFTPSASPLTNTGANTQLLTLQDNVIKDNSTNNFKISSLGSISIKDISPFTSLSSTSIDRSIHGGSGYFGTINEYLSIPESGFQFLTGGGNFTFEFWIYPTQTTNSGFIFDKRTTASGASPFYIKYNAGGFINYGISNGTAYFVNLTSPSAIKVNQWAHIAAVRSGSNALLYINGVLSISSASFSATPLNNGQNFLIGKTSTTTTEPVSAYLSNIRITNTALYTTSGFSLSTSPLTNTNDTLLLLNTNNYGVNSTAVGTYPISSFTGYDGSNNQLNQYPQNWQILTLDNPLTGKNKDVVNYFIGTTSPNQLSLMSGPITGMDVSNYANKIFSNGTPSICAYNSPFLTENGFFFNGTSDSYIIPENGPLVLGTNDFTIEGWIYPTAFTSARMIYSTRINNVDTGTNVFGFYINASNKLAVYSSGADLGTATNTLTLNNWYHVAFTRSNNVGRVYLNGNLSFSAVVMNNFNIGKAGVGSNNTGTEYFKGGMFNIRVINGTSLYRRSSFTIPAIPLRVTENTVFLLKSGAAFDQSVISSNVNSISSKLLNVDGINPYMMLSNSILLTKSGTVSASIESPFTNQSLLSASYFFAPNSSLTIPYATNTINLNQPNYLIEFFVKPNAIGNIISCNTSSQGVYGWNIAIKSDRNLLMNTTDHYFWGWAVTTVGSSIILNQWNHVAICLINGSFVIYINGILQSFSSAGTNGFNITPYTVTYTVYGGYPIEIGGGTFSGNIAGLRIINGYSMYSGSKIKVPSTTTVPYLSTQLYISEPYTGNYYYNNNITDTSNLYLGGINTRNITLNSDIIVDNLFINNNTNVNFNPLNNIQLLVKGLYGLQITSGGTLNIGTSSSPVALSSTHTIILSNTQINVYNGGNLNVYGAYKPPYTYLRSDTNSGTNTFILNNALSSYWISGDKLSFISNITGANITDQLTLDAFVSDNTFTTTSNSTYAYNSISSNPYIPTVANLTRNVILSSIGGTDESYFYSNGSKIDINNTSFNFIDQPLSHNINSNGVLNISGCVFDNTVNNLAYRMNYAVNTLATANNNGYIRTDFDTNVIFEKIFTMEFFVSGGFYISDLYHQITQDGGWTLGASIGGKITWTASGVGTIIQSSSNLIGGQWNHIAITRDASNNLRLYINGTLDTNISYSNAITGAINSSRGRILIGASNGDGTYFVSKTIITNMRLIRDQCLYNTNSFTVPDAPLSLISQGAIPINVYFLSFKNKNYKDESFFNNKVTPVGTSVFNDSMPFYKSVVYNQYNTNISNNIFINSKYQSFIIQCLNLINSKIENNLFLSAYASNPYLFTADRYGVMMKTLSCSNTVMNSNYIMGISGIGSYLSNVSSYNSKIGGFISYKTNLVGGLLNGSNTGNISLGSVYGNKEGIYVDSTNSNLDKITFINTLANNNSSVGFKVSGNTLNYLTPTTLNINGLTASNNGDCGIEAYNICGTLSSMTLINNTNYNIKTSIGNGETIFNRVTSIISSKGLPTSACSIAFLSGYNYSRTSIIDSFLSASSILADASASVGLSIDSTRFTEFDLQNSILSAKTPFLIQTNRNLLEGSYIINNSYLGATPLGTGITNKYQNGNVKSTGFAFTNLNMISAYNVSYFTNGSRSLDNTVGVGDTAISERLTPSSFSKKLKSSSKYVAVDKNTNTVIKVFVKKSTVAINGTAYNGNPPRLILKMNASIGINSDMVLAQFDYSSDVFEAITVASPAATNNGVLEFYIDCDGTQGWINIDAWTAL